jgi:molybdopterin converting factor small subunit
MEVEVNLFATLRTTGSDLSRVRLQPGARVAELLENLGVPFSKVAVVLVNGTRAELDHELKENDVVSLFPAIAGG